LNRKTFFHECVRLGERDTVHWFNASLIVVNMEPNSKHGQLRHGAAHETHGNHGEPAAIVGAHSGHNRHAGHSVAIFRDKFWLSLALTLPVVFWSGEVQHWLGYRSPTFPGSRLIPAILGTIIMVYGGSVFSGKPLVPLHFVAVGVINAGVSTVSPTL
jgi:hypothetical protein